MTNTTDRIQGLCASIINHDEWYALKTHILMTCPASGIESVRHAISTIEVSAESGDEKFKKAKRIKQQEEGSIDPDLEEA
jgi:hypothetical protein